MTESPVHVPRMQQRRDRRAGHFNPLASVIVFQYNPDTLERTIAPQGSEGGEGADRSEVLRLKGPPQETIKVEIELDATDQLEKDERPARDKGSTRSSARWRCSSIPRAR